MGLSRMGVPHHDCRNDRGLAGGIPVAWRAARMALGRARTLLGSCRSKDRFQMSGWLAIVNPHSGGSSARARLPSLLRHLKGLVEKTVFTEYPGHAAEIAKAAAGYTGLAAVGGDGTLFEILKGLDRERQRVAIFPAGRGNSLARDLGLFGKVPGLDEIGQSDPLYIDLMEVTVRNSGGLEARNLSASTVAIGYPVAITRASRGFPRHLGKFCYAAATTFVRPAPFEIEVSRENGSR